MEKKSELKDLAVGVKSITRAWEVTKPNKTLKLRLDINLILFVTSDSEIGKNKIK